MASVSRNSTELMDAMRSSYRSKMITAAVVAFAIGGVSGFLAGSSFGDSTNTSTVTAAPVESNETFDTDGGWSEQGAIGEALLADESAPLPVGVNPSDSQGLQSPYGWNFVTFDPSRPTVTLWEDFQCPACAGFERSPVKTAIMQKADAGDINLIFRPLSFLDLSLGNDSSARATAAWGCAIDAGVGEKYRSLVFVNQPAEGAGFTEAELLSGGELAGLTGEEFTGFQECVTSGTYKAWSGTSSFNAPPEVGGTPTVMVDGVALAPADANNLDFVNNAIAEAAK